MSGLVDGPSTENLQRAVAPHLGRVYRLPQIGFRASTVTRLTELCEQSNLGQVSMRRGEAAVTAALGANRPAVHAGGATDAEMSPSCACR